MCESSPIDDRKTCQKPRVISPTIARYFAGTTDGDQPAPAGLGILGMMAYARRRERRSGGFLANQAKQGLATHDCLR
jgi:MYXO-CTERM domain-containing protein